MTVTSTMTATVAVSTAVTGTVAVTVTGTLVVTITAVITGKKLPLPLLLPVKNCLYRHRYPKSVARFFPASI